MSHPGQTQGSLRSSSTWKISCYPISRQEEGAECCGGVRGRKRIKRAVRHSEVISCQLLPWLIPMRWTLDLRARTVCLCSALLTLSFTGAHWAHHPPSKPDSLLPKEAGRSRRMRLPLPSHFKPFNIWRTSVRLTQLIHAWTWHSAALILSQIQIYLKIRRTSGSPVYLFILKMLQKCSFHSNDSLPGHWISIPKKKTTFQVTYLKKKKV